MKETEKHAEKWKHIPRVHNWNNQFVKMSILLKIIPTKLPMTFFTEVEKNATKICMQPQITTKK